MLHIVLLRPQIPQNTGNIGRMCAVTRSRLHLIHPLGYKITDAALRRAGMDYWFSLDVKQHADWASFTASEHAPRRLWLIETGGKRSIWEAPFEDGDGLVFGNEGHGTPAEIMAEFGAERILTIPHANTELRSLNLSTAAGVACYEALRQIGLPASSAQ